MYSQIKQIQRHLTLLYFEGSLLLNSITFLEDKSDIIREAISISFEQTLAHLLHLVVGCLIGEDQRDYLPNPAAQCLVEIFLQNL